GRRAANRLPLPRRNLLAAAIEGRHDHGQQPVQWLAHGRLVARPLTAYHLCPRPPPGSIFGRRVRALKVTIRPLMQIERINTDEGLEALLPEWIALWQRVPHATPFQSPLWLTAWWRQFGTGMARIVIAHAGGRLI